MPATHRIEEVATALHRIQRGEAVAEAARKAGVEAATVEAWQREHPRLRLKALLAEGLEGECELQSGVVDQLLEWGQSEWDVALIHPPHVVDSGERRLLAMPWTHRHIGSSMITEGGTIISPLWDVAPMGFAVMGEYLREKRGHRCAGFNLAGLATWINRAWKGRGYPLVVNLEAGNRRVVEFAVRQIRAKVYAVGLHWVVHCSGAMELLRLIKEAHPESCAVIGGLTSSVFAEQALQQYPFLDAVVIGDGCVPLGEVVERVKHGTGLGGIANLAYREGGEVRSGPSEELSDRERLLEVRGAAPWVQLGRGCVMNCVTCGGSCAAGRRIWRQGAVQPYAVDEVMAQIHRVTAGGDRDGDILLIHDPMVILGRARWRELVGEIRRQGVRASFAIEVYRPWLEEDIREAAEALPGSTLHFSPESMDEEVRALQRGARFSNAELLANLNCVNDTDGLSLQVWFMAGVAGDTPESVRNTLAFVREYYPRLRSRQSAIKYNTLTFVDPGSEAWVEPEAHGYRLLSRELPWYVEAFALPHWKAQINYETAGRSRGEVWRTFMDMHDAMNEIYHENGLLSAKQLGVLTRYGRLLRAYEERYDAAAAMTRGERREKRLGELGAQLRDEMGEELGHEAYDKAEHGHAWACR